MKATSHSVPAAVQSLSAKGKSLPARPAPLQKNPLSSNHAEGSLPTDAEPSKAMENSLPTDGKPLSFAEKLLPADDNPLNVGKHPVQAVAKPLKVLLLNTSESTGGAAVAANRLMHALQKAGVDAKMLVRDKRTDDPKVVSVNTTFWRRKINFLRFAWERLVIFLHNRLDRKDLFRVSIADTGTDVSRHPLVKAADVIHLHWINQGFLSLKDVRALIRTGKPVVWTLHDMWPCTAICHYSCGCERYKASCGACPFLHSDRSEDLSFKTFRKKRFLKESPVHLATVSSWLKEIARTSALTQGLPVTVIPNVLDTGLFRPADRQEARETLGLPLDRKIILMGAARINDPIKGFEVLQQALQAFVNRRDVLLVLFGGIKGDDSFLTDLPVAHVWMGLLADPARIARLYAAADVTVVPSHYETFGQTLIESMACGCPAVSFDNSGQRDIIDHKANGYLARYPDPSDLAAGIEWVFTHPEPAVLADACLRKIEAEYTEAVVARKYLDLYNRLLTV